jgi:hypothetical protein
MMKIEVTNGVKVKWVYPGDMPRGYAPVEQPKPTKAERPRVEVVEQPDEENE